MPLSDLMHCSKAFKTVSDDKEELVSKHALGEKSQVPLCQGNAPWSQNVVFSPRE